MLVDAGDIVVHIMQPAVRAYYNLEELWTPPAAKRRARVPTARQPDAVAGSGQSRGPRSRNSACHRVRPIRPTPLRDEASRRRARPPDAGVGRRRLGRVRAADAARVPAGARRAEARAARSRQAGTAAARGRGRADRRRVPGRADRRARRARQPVDDAHARRCARALARRGARRRVRDRQRGRARRRRSSAMRLPSWRFPR